MLALRECLLRESNSTTSLNSNCLIKEDRDEEKQPKSVASKHSNIFEKNLSSSTTANTSCQEQQTNSNPKLKSEYTSTYRAISSSNKKINAPDVTTSPAYYTDEYLRIKAPSGSPLSLVASTEAESPSINENYRSVYTTPSKLITSDSKQRIFSKSPIANSAPPPIAAKRTIFRHSPTERKELTKGDLNASQCSTLYDKNIETDGNASPVPLLGSKPVPKERLYSASESPTIHSQSSPNAGRFSNRKRVVRVRSDSRPISALYDIICKEKGLELDQESTMNRASGGIVGFESPSSLEPTHAQNQNQTHQEHLHQHVKLQQDQVHQQQSQEQRDTIMHPFVSSSQLNSNSNLNVNRYDNDNDDIQNRLQMKPDILTSTYLASELNRHYQPYDHSHPDHDLKHDHDNNQDHDHQFQHDLHLLHSQPHSPSHDQNLPSRCVDSRSLNNCRETSSYVNRYNELSDIHEAAGAGDDLLCLNKANGHAQQMAAPIPAPRSRLRAVRDEKRRFTDGMLVTCTKGETERKQIGNGRDADVNKRGGSHPDSLSAVGRRYITRSNRASAGGGGSNSNSSDSSPSPTQNQLTSTYSSRLRSPLKSPSINRPISHHNYLGTSPPGSARINGNDSNYHPHQQQERQSDQQKHDPLDPARSVMTNSVGAVAASAPSTLAAVSPLNDFCGKPKTPVNNTTDLSADDRSVTKSSTPASSIVSKNNQNQNHQHRPSQHVHSAQSGPSQHHQTAPVHIIRTTKTSRLRAAALDKKRDSDDQHSTRQSSPRRSSRKSNGGRLSASYNNSPDVVRTADEHGGGVRARRNPSPTNAKKLIPSMTVSMRQNLNELQYNGSGVMLRRERPHTIDCTVKVASSKKGLSEVLDVIPSGGNNNDEDHGEEFNMRPRSSTLNSESNRGRARGRNERDKDFSPSPVKYTRNTEAQRIDNRDKSSKRKSNLNRALNEEAIADDDLALRRRRRRELGMARQLIPSDETSTAVRELFLSSKKSNVSPTSPKSDLAMHMENARKGIGLISPTGTERRRAQTASPKIGGSPSSPNKISETRMPRRTTEPSEHLRRQRVDVSQKVDAMRERTKSKLAEIMKITERCTTDQCQQHIESEDVLRKPPGGLIVNNPVDDLITTLDRLSAKEAKEEKPTERKESSSSPKCIKKDRISFDDCEDFHSDGASSLGFLRKRMLKARSVEREISIDQPKLSPILRRKSSEEPTNHIVSILKKKDTMESSSASSNASPVTFASTTMDTSPRNKRQGILKKRSSLDESRYYSRSHSPDERSILVKNARRNSLEEIQHGILKQSSYESRSDGCPSAEPHHGILKKKDSTSTPSDSGHSSRHVSISQAVILAAAELCKDIGTSSSSPPNSNDSEYDNIRPILKVDSQEIRTPKPILKKKSSSETEEIRPILKTSRKSSREECSDLSDDQGVKPILKTDSPAKRMSFTEVPENGVSNILLPRRRSLERSVEEEAVESAPSADERPILSVAERVRNMERFLNTCSSRSFDSESPFVGEIAKLQRQNALKRDIYKDRFRTQPVTNDEIECLQATAPRKLGTFKPGLSLDTLNYTGKGGGTGPTTGNKISPRSLSSISPSPREVSELFSPRSVTDLNCFSISSDSGLQTGKNLEMSSGQEDNSLRADESLSTAEGLTGNDSNRLSRDDSLTLCEDDGSNPDVSGPFGLGRSGSVKARASMFQQLEERTKSNRKSDDKAAISTPIRKGSRRLASPPTPADQPTTPSDPPANTDEEFEPSSLPLAERLRFFASLSAGTGSQDRPVSRLQYYQQQLYSERRSSSSSVASMTTSCTVSPSPNNVVPMECEDTASTPSTVTETRVSSNADIVPMTPTSSVPTLKRMKLKAVGKLMMPNFTSEGSFNSNENSDDNSPTTNEPLRKIGKIKSPFIENSRKCVSPMMFGKTNNKYFKQDSITGKTDDNIDGNGDSGKENYENCSPSIELRRKKVNSSSSSGISSVPTSQRSSYQRSPLIDEKYAKYFGITVNSPSNSRTTTPKTPQKTFEYNNIPDVCRVTPKPLLRQQNCTRNSDEYQFIQKSCSMREVRGYPSSPLIDLSPDTSSVFSESFDDNDFNLSQPIKRRDAIKRTRAMTAFANTPQSTPDRTKAPTLRALRNRSMVITNPRFLPLQNPITKYEDLKVTKEDLQMASKEFDRIFLESTRPIQPLLSPPFTASGKGILKSKSGCVGFMPMDLNSELKNRLKRSTHAAVSNLRKSATVENAAQVVDLISTKRSDSSSSEDDGVDPQKNLAKILRSVSKENMNRQLKEHITPIMATANPRPSSLPQHDDTVSLVRNLSSLEKRIPEVHASTPGVCAVSTSEGESSGGREITEIIKNSAVARRRKLNDG